MAAEANRGGATPASERIDLLDALRGFALLGILLANMLYWSGWSFVDHAQQVALAGAEQAAAANWLHKLLIDGKFYSLFSLMFGIGFALQLIRLERRGADGLRIFRRRMLVLLLFGLIHLFLVWDGDILTLYALLGLALPFARSWSDRALALTALALLLLPLPGVWALAELGWKPSAPFIELSEWLGAQWYAGDPYDEVLWLSQEDWRSHWGWLMGGWPWRIITILDSWRIPKVLAMMLLGLILGRRLAAGTLLDDRRLLVRTLLAGLAAGLPLSAWYASIEAGDQAHPSTVLGTAPLALAYAAAFVLLWPRARAVLCHLAPVGRMALTNYLMHSLLGIAIFYGIGFGLVGKLAPAGFYGVVVAIFAFQLLVSRWWLARHAQGPMEWLWRKGTYGRIR
jgi:uncharacterized protein